jgi:hypothetical protein
LRNRLSSFLLPVSAIKSHRSSSAVATSRIARALTFSHSYTASAMASDSGTKRVCRPLGVALAPLSLIVPARSRVTFPSQ